MRELVGGILTPALSLGERVERRPPSGESCRAVIAQRRPCLPPLPEGEGWGEGEAMPDNGDAKNSFAAARHGHLDFRGKPQAQNPNSEEVRGRVKLSATRQYTEALKSEWLKTLP